MASQSQPKYHHAVTSPNPLSKLQHHWSPQDLIPDRLVHEPKNQNNNSCMQPLPLAKQFMEDKHIHIACLPIGKQLVQWH